MTRTRPPLPFLALAAGSALLLLGGGGYILQLRPDLPPLLPQARRIAPLSDRTPFYGWISDREWLTFRDPARQDFTFVRRPIDGASETALAPLSALFQKTQGIPQSVRLSPDGSRILWATPRQEVIATTLDARRPRAIRRLAEGGNVWMLDSLHWMEVDQQEDQYSYARAHPADAPAEAALRPQPLSYPFPKAVADIDGAATTTEGWLLVHLRKPGAAIQTALVVNTGFGANPTASRTLQFPAPYANAGGGLTFEPRSLHMAWTLYIDPPRTRFLKEWGLRSAQAPPRQIGLWVTDQSTKKTICLGTLEGPPEAMQTRSTQFLPGAKSLSFIYQNALWVTPVP